MQKSKILVRALFVLLAFIFTFHFFSHNSSRVSVLADDTASTNPTLPSTPLAPSLQQLDQGVRLSWLPAQPGSFALAGYIIQRQHPGLDWETITTLTSADSITYDDTQAQPSDSYRIIAFDSASPPNQSELSASVTFIPPTTDLALDNSSDSLPPISPTPAPAPSPTEVTTPAFLPSSPDLTVTPSPIDTTTPEPTLSPSPTISFLSPSPSVELSTPLPIQPSLTPAITPPITSPSNLTSSTPLAPETVNSILQFSTQATLDQEKAQASPPAQRVSNLEQLTTQYVSSLNNVAINNRSVLAQPILHHLQQTEQKVLTDFSTTSQEEKTSAKQKCKQQSDDLETTLTLLPDLNHLEVYKALALCTLIQKHL